MKGKPAAPYLGIGEVLVELRGEFPDITVSKIRFLESAGLVAPARSPSGYRRFAPEDIDRLRVILLAQRDQYLPLRVIKERGGYVLGQDEASCVVYGMPRAAAVAGLVDRVVSLEAVPRTLCELAGIAYAV